MDASPDQDYGAAVFETIRGWFDESISEEQMQNAYANVRLWLDEQGIGPENGLQYLQDHLDQAKTIATGPAYETVMAQKTDTPESSKSGKNSWMSGKNLLIVGVAVAVIYLLFFKSESE